MADENKKPLSFMQKLGCSWGPALAAGCLILLIVGGIIFVIALVGTVFIRGFSGQPYIQGALASGVNCKISYPSGGDEAKMASYIDSIIPGSPLKGLGQSFVNSGKTGGIHPLMIAFFAKKESSWGTAGIATRGTNNPFGRTATANQPHIEINGRLWYRFNSWQEAIEMHGPYLKTRYIDQGLTTVEQIMNVYCPRSECDTDGYIQQMNSFIASNIAKSGGVFGPDPCALSGIEGQMTWPVPGHTRISSPFGMRNNPVTGRWSMHNGIDIPAPGGTTIIAPYNGVVEQYIDNSICGTGMMIDHGGGIKTAYCHLQNRIARPGQVVNVGQKIAEVSVGINGNSTGPHLHFGVKEGEKYVNPCIKYLSC